MALWRKNYFQKLRVTRRNFIIKKEKNKIKKQIFLCKKLKCNGVYRILCLFSGSNPQFLASTYLVFCS